MGPRESDTPMLSAGWFRVQELARSKTSGLVLILSGLAIAAHGALSDFDSSWAPSAARVDPGVASLKTRSQLAAETSLSAIIPPMPGTSPPAAAPSAPVIVTLAPRSVEAAPSRTAAIPRDRDSLARELQKELRRVGCYEGELNGVWTPATRRAMKTFTDRVNATLPVDEPDAVLFAMVQSQQDRVCGKPCPVDQGLSEDGRCLPNAILAKAARKPSPSAVATHVPASGGPAAAKPLSARGWSATVTAVGPTPPAVGAPAAPMPPQALAVIAPAPAPPPPAEGRMALAGPIDGQAATDPRLAAKPTARLGRARPSQHGALFVSAPRPRTFVSSQFRRIESRL
jgi:hypothetical protein